MPLSELQIRRYARHILLSDMGGVGQERLLAAAVAVEVGADRPASVVALAYLAAAGVGRLRLTGDVDGLVSAREVRDAILLGTADVGRVRADALAARLGALNPDVVVERAPDRAAAGVEGSTDGSAEAWLRCEPGGDLAAALIAGGGAACRRIAAIARGQT
jgi:adenylyltransferase/sulfurtransferase